MLIRVSISNFKSFNEDTEFNMLASSDQRTYKEHIYTQGSLDLLKVAALYGANGSGKSNLIKAVATLQQIVLKGGRAALNEVEPFRLATNENKPTTIEIEYIQGGVPYLFGVSVLSGIIQEEWLYESGLGQKEDKLLFRREAKGDELDLDFGNQYISTEEGKFRLKFYRDEFLKNDTLLFKELANLKEGFEEIKNAYNWFANQLLIIFPGAKPRNLAARLESSPQFKFFADELICSFHTGVAEMTVETLDAEDFFGKGSETLDKINEDIKGGAAHITLAYGSSTWGIKKRIEVSLKNELPVVKQLVTKHENEAGELVDFTMDEESDGTNRLLDFIPAFYRTVTESVTILIDEIDQSIHPTLLKELVRKFVADPTTKGQLIFTTHESNLLDQNIFRRDEIWFVEKHEGATKLYPLSDFDIRLDLDIRKGYLNGRFGAIPFLGNLADLNWNRYAEV